MDKIGVVTITYNSENVLPSFLECIYNQTYSNLILYVIDNGSTDCTLSILKGFDNFPIRITENLDNLGVAKANNQGIIQAIEDECDQILLINNDVEFESILVENLLRAQKDYNCSLVAPKMMYFDQPNLIWYAGSWFKKCKGYLPLHRGLSQKDEGQYDEVIEVEYAPTCCLLAKKEIFTDIGFMDEKYFVYFDDTDFSYRVWKDKRHKMFYVPKAKLFHKVGSLTKSFTKTLTVVPSGFISIEPNFVFV